jgi:uroporphyrinogen decarboxylase
VVAYEKLKKHLGIDGPNVFVTKMMQNVAVDERILNQLDIDVRGVFPGGADKGSQTLPDGTWIDEWGVERRKPEGSYYYDLTKAPLAGEISISDIVHYPWPDPHDPGYTRGLREQLRHWRETTDCAVVVTLPGAVVHASQYMRGFEDWYADVALNPKLLEVLLDACLEVTLGVMTEILRVVGDDVDIAMCADDLGAQSGLQFSPEHYRKLFKPRHARYFETIHSLTQGKLLYHTCGSVYDVIDDLIEIGIEVLNPVQPRAANMNPGMLKRKFGNRLAFWGAIDIQEVMPFGSVDDVYAEVRQRFEELGAGGGWVLCPAHNLQPEVPPENVMALYRAGKEIGKYS